VLTEDRVEELEARVALVEQRLRRVEGAAPRAVAVRAAAAETTPPAAAAESAPPRPSSTPGPPSPADASARAAAVTPAPKSPALDLERLFGGRVLAWLGAVAVLAGLAMLLALAIASGWLGESARTLLAGGASAVLVAVGAVLHERRGRTEAARAAVGAGLAGLFLTLTVATRAYDLVPAALGLPLALAVGAVATTLAVRWHARAIAGIGIVGAILSPVLTDAPLDGDAMPYLLLAVGCATAVVLWRRWNWLALAGFVAAAPQVVAFAASADELPAVAVLAIFGGLNAVAALGYEVRVPADRVRLSSAFLLGLNAVVLAPTGYLVLDAASTRTAAIAWLAGLAVAHALAAAAIARRAPRARDARDLCLVLAVLVADAAVVIATEGGVRAIAWAGASVLFAVLARRLRIRDEDEAQGRLLAELGLGGHVALALVQALAQIHLADFAAPGLGGGEVAALGALAAACLVSGRLADGGREGIRRLLDGTGLAAVALIAALTLDGAALTVAWALEAVVLARIARRSGGDPVASAAAVAHLGLAAVWGLVNQAPPAHLIDGAVALGPALIGVGSVAAAALLMAREVDDSLLRRGLLAGAGIALLYLASLAAVGLAPDPSSAEAVHLGTAQQGQLQLSTLWAVVGVAGLLVGLRRDVRELRLAALGLLGLTTVKVFLFDLATLDAGYRIGSFIAVGILLLLGSFAYARLRPEALADLREVPDGLR
jgi:uncharacterized membrane protein